ncbi:MAG: acyltransferase [Chthoniobacteraceae bacterium]
MSAPDIRSDHIQRLDVLRGLAILAVFLFHFLGTIYQMDHLPWRGWWPDWSAAPDRTFLWLFPFTFGWVGVSLFFVLSGFCIHLAFLRKPVFSLGAFYRARFWRIYPAYAVALLFFAALGFSKFSRPETWGDLAAHLTLTHNFFPSTYYTFSPAFWSLAVESQFYLAFPLFLALRSRLGIGRTLVVAGVAALLLRLGIALFVQASDASLNVWLYSTPVLWFDWILGAYLAECSFRKCEPRLPRHPLVIPLVVGALILAALCKPLTPLRFPIASVLSALIMARYLQNRSALAKWERVCVPLGLISYSFYLWHQPLMGRVMKLLHRAGLPETPWLVFTVGLTATLAIIAALSWFLYRHVELRFIRRPKKIDPPKVVSYAC